MWGFHTHNLWHRVYLLVYFLLPIFKILYQIPVTFRHVNAVACSYSDIEMKSCQLFRHPHNWRYSSASQHEVPVLSTNFVVHFQTFHTFISRLTSVLAFAIVFVTISKNESHKTHLRYHSAYDSRDDKTEFLTLECATCLELFPIKLTVRPLPAAGNFSGIQTDRQTPPVAPKFCK
jgi:3'-phosphoadenosine 5'-phosphosulfate sulfotransferase (PAPS reductase)/FAD synthetase